MERFSVETASDQHRQPQAGQRERTASMSAIDPGDDVLDQEEGRAPDRCHGEQGHRGQPHGGRRYTTNSVMVEPFGASRRPRGSLKAT